MEAVVSSYPNSLLRFPSSSLPKSKFGRPLFSLTPTNFEITDGASVFATQRNLRQLRISTVRADNNRRDRSLEDEGNNVPQSSHGKESNPSDQEEMIALFRRIGSSISEGESARSKTRRSKASAESLLDVLVQSRKPVTEKTSNKEWDKVLTQRCDPSKNNEKIEYYPPAADPKSTRPPSNFVKRSPIQSPVRFNRKAEPESEEESISMVGVEKVEGMKVSELKELAKSRGIKGYSKLKKSELIELLTRSEERNPHPC